MGWDLSWLTGLFSGKEAEVKEPEILVFGAELKCSQGTENSFLMVDTNSICLDGLPQANVSDRVIQENIMPFGVCQMGAFCQQIAELQEEWINPTPQKIIVRGKEAITTESFLLCNRCGGEIRAVNSGQDGVEAARIFAEMELLKEIEEKYPGLLEILMNPNGSLYLQEGMYQKALQFLSDCVEKYGGNIEILSLGNPNTLEGMLMNAALGHLVVEFDGSTEVWRRDRMTQIGTELGFDGLPGWDVGVLNKDMMGFLAEICEDRAKNIENNSVWRWAENNKELGKSMYETANALAFMYIASQYVSTNQQKPKVESLSPNERAYNYYSELAEELDVSTAPNTAVFYSGNGNQELAKAFADMNGKVTLEMTEGGKYLHSLELFNPEVSPLTQEQAHDIWARVSERYAQQASGNTYGFVKGASSTGIFNQYEYPALQNNANVTNIFTELFQ